MQSQMPPVNTPDNLFHDGDPTQGLEGTVVTAGHLNNEQAAIRDVQQELINVLAAAAMQPDPNKQDQLITAINAILGKPAAGFVVTVNSEAPDAAGNVQLDAANVGASPAGHSHTANEVGASPVGHGHTPAEAGAYPITGGTLQGGVDAQGDISSAGAIYEAGGARVYSPNNPPPTQPNTGVLDVALGAQIWRDYGGGSPVIADPGCVMTGIQEDPGDNEIHGHYFRSEMKNVGGEWYIFAHIG